MRKKISIFSPLILLAVLILFSACEPLPEPSDFPTPVQNTIADLPGSTEVLPTATELPPSIPLAVRVNGFEIPLQDYEREMQHYRASFDDTTPMPSDEEMKQTVLNFLVEQQLLAEAAQQNGYTISDEALQAKLNDLAQEMGGQEALDAWMQANFHSQESLIHALRLADAAAHQRDLIISQVPDSAEQVRARQIFSTRQGDLIAAEKSLAEGKSFEELAWQFVPESGGELGWFPRGFLLFPELEQAAFSLPVGSTSQVIQTELGFHILYIIAHEESHPLTTDARVMLQSKALEAWLTTAKEQAEIEILVP